MNKHKGTTFDNFLNEEGLLEDIEAVAKKEYDFSKAKKNPYIQDLKQVTIKLDTDTIKSEVKSSLRSRLDSGKGSFASPEEADAFIRSERDKWE